ncbi:type II toxin-antitoxin system PemK/MazF family toxin [Alicyclobacillus tolerans]|uniref:Transcriptional modulator of MazE/toxin, MazF n=1 Tax=Alicyclobacillus tolerans TaxID=90970 RepID=A0A1M6U9Q7_9BACL|nr:transcriptional modulator of MazE/toxin, MazF [Alicyclobacillus montanus]
MSYVPERGDLVRLDFNPQAGHEQAGWRPAVVISPKAYNETFGLMLACPITNQDKGFPFEVPLPDGVPITGVVLADHLKNVDWRARKVQFVCSIAESHDEFFEEIVERIKPLIF